MDGERQEIRGILCKKASKTASMIFFYPEDPQELISPYFNLGMLILLSLNVIAVIFCKQK